MPFLSVIIPIYKVEPYLRQCIESVLDQQLDDYELILVDDGSPDGCPQICDEYAGRFAQVRVIHQKNGGLSVARNTGLRAATGQYLMFLDSDDWWNSEVCVRKMLVAVKEKPEVDMFLFAGLDYYEGKGLFERSDSVCRQAGATMDPARYYRTMLAAGNLQVHAATKVIKTSFVRQNALYFQCGITGEDNEWIIRILRSYPVISILPEPLYIYRAGRLGSISNTIHKKNVNDLLSIVNSSLVYYDAQDVDQSVMEYELCFCAYLWFCALGLSDSLPASEKGELSKLFSATSSVCRYSNSRKTRMAYVLYRTVGLTMTRWLLRRYITCRNAFRWNKKKIERA